MTSRCGLVLVTLAVSISAFACDYFAGVYVQNDAMFDVMVTVNGGESRGSVAPGQTGRFKANDNTKLRDAEITLNSNPPETRKLSFDTKLYQRLRVTGPPLAVEVTLEQVP